ncbi:MAG: aromatic amino acid lyase [Pikeienuella sp.]
MTDAILLTGRDLTVDTLQAILAGAPVVIAPEGITRMARARAVIDHAVDAGQPVYGVTTGLGPRVVEALPRDELEAFALATIRGRAHSVGEDLPEVVCRAALAARLNTLLIGAAGVRPALAEMLAGCLNAGLAPAMRAVGSIGAADLMWGGDFGLALIGEGRMWHKGQVAPADEALSAVGLAPWTPATREGLALVSHSSPSAGLAAVAIARASEAIEHAQTTAALVMEGFRANLSILDPDLLAVRPQPGQSEAATGLSLRLAGSGLHQENAARRLQDPLSIRNTPQIHGAVLAAIETAKQAAEAELNGASDNPGVMVKRGEVASHGGYLTPHLMITLGAVAQSLTLLAAVQCARIGKMNAARFTDLRNGLASGAGMGAGLAPAMKTAEALMAEIAHAGAAPPVYPGFSADGLEDVACHTAIAGKSVLRQVELLQRLTAIEAIAGVRAITLRDNGKTLSPRLRAGFQRVSAVSPVGESDRALGTEIETIASNLAAVLAFD